MVPVGFASQPTRSANPELKPVYSIQIRHNGFFLLLQDKKIIRSHFVVAEV